MARNLYIQSSNFPFIPMTSKSELEKVQNLYIIQMELWRFLDSDTLDAEDKKKAQKSLRIFGTLLNQVDPSYMGGEDVLETLYKIKADAATKLRKASGRKKEKVAAVKS